MYTFYRGIHTLILVGLMAVTLLPSAQTLHAKAPDTKIAHVWRFTYEQGPQAGILDVMIVEHEVATHDIVQILQQFTYGVPCTVHHGRRITCDLDIRSAIQDAYIQMGLDGLAAQVPSAESYKWMIVESTGHWNTAPGKTSTDLARHPSLTFDVTTGSKAGVTFTSSWNSNSSTSFPYKINPGLVQTMRNHFRCEQVNSCSVQNSLVTNGMERGLGGITFANPRTVTFQLVATPIQIMLPDGYQLDTFVIDPPKAGYG